MRKVALMLIAALVVTAAASNAAVLNTKHDLKSWITTGQKEICVFCHTPHQSGTSTDPLWNHTLSTVANYGVYDSTTLNAAPTDVGGGTTVSNLCLSCHDGTISRTSMYNPPNAGTLTDGGVITGDANLGTDLTNDHPVNFTYNAALVTADGNELNDPTIAPVAPLLFGGTVQCASCHDPHDNTNAPFLTVDNTNSGLCTTCHIK